MFRRLLALAITFLLSQLLCSNTAAQTRYPAERNHSPITRQVTQRLNGIVADGLSQGKISSRFIKVGDSITVTPNYFMGQYIHPDYDPAVHSTYDFTRDLDRYEYLRQSMEYFLAEVISGGETSFDRQSLAAQIGQTASWAVSGDPSPLQQEIDAVSPLYAVIMFGTNDIGWWPDDHYTMSWIIEHLAEIVDYCIAEGTVPILKAPPPRVDDSVYELKMLTLSHLIRALAQARQIPFVDYHRAMVPLPDSGLGGDGVHPNVYQGNWMCHLTPAGLQYGTNMHNLVAMQAFDRALRATVKGTPALDFEPPALVGDGTQGSPLQVDGIPFVDAHETTADGLDVYYSFTLAESTQLRFMTMDQGTVDVDVSILNDALEVLYADDGQLDITLGAGQYSMVVETSGGSAANAGEYQALIMDRTSTGMPSSHGILIDGAKATPSDIGPGQPTTITFTVTALDDAAISGVTLDLSELGGDSSVAMTHLGDGSFSHSASLPAQTLGEKLVTVTAHDNEANQSSIPVFVMVGTTLTVINNSVAGGAGTVTSSPAGIDCGDACSHEFSNGTPVTLTASAADGSIFAGWSGACSGTDLTCVVTMTMSQTVTATFEPEDHTYNLSVTKSGTGDGTVSSSPAGINCGSDCTQDFPSGTPVTLTAAADGASTFTGWSGACFGTGDCIVTMSAIRSVTAAFHSNTVPAVVIYDDALASGWANWSWGGTFDVAGTAEVYSGQFAIDATINGFGGFSPATQSAVIDTYGYEAITFWVHGRSGSDKHLSFFTQAVADGGEASTAVDVTAVANTWTEVTVTLNELGNPAAIARLNFFNNSSSDLTTITLDDIRLEPRTSANSVFEDGFESGNTSAWQ